MRQPESTRRARTIPIWTLAIIAVDQLTKVAAGHLAAGHTSGAIVPLRNREFTLGIAAPPERITLIICAVGIVVFGAHVVRATMRYRFDPALAALVLGGAMSNLIDRLVGGSVRDFLATPWVVFNLADVAVVVGLVGYLLARLRTTRIESPRVLEEVRI